MKIKNVKPGDILTIKKKPKPEDVEAFFDHHWKVVKIYENHVLAHSIKTPQIRRSFCYGDLVLMGLEIQYIERTKHEGRYF